MKIGFVRYMRAHGQVPGPGERPRLAGALAGTVAGLATLPLLNGSGATASLAPAIGNRGWLVQLLFCIAWLLAGAVYAFVFGRAANDRRGGWLFGLAYGFLVWMIGPVALLQVFLDRQLVTGLAAAGVLAANLIAGLVLGILFRHMYIFVRKPLRRLSREQPATVEANP